MHHCRGEGAAPWPTISRVSGSGGSRFQSQFAHYLFYQYSYLLCQSVLLPASCGWQHHQGYWSTSRYLDTNGRHRHTPLHRAIKTPNFSRFAFGHLYIARHTPLCLRKRTRRNLSMHLSLARLRGTAVCRGSLSRRSSHSSCARSRLVRPIYLFLDKPGSTSVFTRSKQSHLRQPRDPSHPTSNSIICIKPSSQEISPARSPMAW